MRRTIPVLWTPSRMRFGRLIGESRRTTPMRRPSTAASLITWPRSARCARIRQMHKEAMARNPVYHDPPLQEKKAAESSMEAPPERLFPEAADRMEQTADASAPEEPAAHAALDAFLHQAGELHMAEGQTPLPEAAPVEPVTASESPCTPASTANVAPQPSAAASDAQTFEQRRDNTVIGFT